MSTVNAAINLDDERFCRRAIEIFTNREVNLIDDLYRSLYIFLSNFLGKTLYCPPIVNSPNGNPKMIRIDKKIMNEKTLAPTIAAMTKNLLNGNLSASNPPKNL